MDFITRWGSLRQPKSVRGRWRSCPLLAKEARSGVPGTQKWSRCGYCFTTTACGIVSRTSFLNMPAASWAGQFIQAIPDPVQGLGPFTPTQRKQIMSTALKPARRTPVGVTPAQRKTLEGLGYSTENLQSLMKDTASELLDACS